MKGFFIRGSCASREGKNVAQAAAAATTAPGNLLRARHVQTTLIVLVHTHTKAGAAADRRQPDRDIIIAWLAGCLNMASQFQIVVSRSLALDRYSTRMQQIAIQKSHPISSLSLSLHLFHGDGQV